MGNFLIIYIGKSTCKRCELDKLEFDPVEARFRAEFSCEKLCDKASIIET